MTLNRLLVMVCILILLIWSNITFGNNPLRNQVVESVKTTEIARAKAFLLTKPVTVTDAFCERSAGGRHDFYSEGDYWWPDTSNPNGPYVRKDGQSNPNNFVAHRRAMVRLSEIVATLTSAWLVSKDQIYADKALEHLNAWFVDSATAMNPSMLYAQAIWGRYTGRGIGLIDAYHLVEVAQSVKVLANKGAIPEKEAGRIISWFEHFLQWMTAHEYGIKEMNTKNNHATCWVATAAAMAVLTDNHEMIEFCSDRFKTVLLPNQMAKDGSFPREIERTKPYGYSLFNIDAFCIVAQILSTPENNLWEFESPGGVSLKRGIDFIYPYIVDKSLWPYQKDIYIWEEWPVAHPSLLFAALAYNNNECMNSYLKLDRYSTHSEVIRNLPVRHPLIWIEE